MSKPKDFYWGNLVRTISEVKDHAKRNKFSCQHQPLVDIALENIVLDELHLMLRVTGQLFFNNIYIYIYIYFCIIINYVFITYLMFNLFR